MTSAHSTSSNEAQIRKLIDNVAEAVRAKDVDGVLAAYAPDVLSFDVVNPLQYVGSDSARKRAEEWFASFDGPIDYLVRDLSVTAGETVAFCHSLNGINATRKDGGRVDMWIRTTICCLKVDDRWLVTHVHSSVPFDVATGKASLDLEPSES